MADNVQANVGTGGDVIAADDIASVKYQRIKLIHGADGVNAGDVATGNPLPVVQTGTPALPTGAATAAKQPALGTAGTASTDVITVQGIASGTPQPISGTVTANAGTNLNTSTLALETGGNLATVKTNTDNLASAQSSTTSGQKGPIVQGAVTTSNPTYTTGQTNPISLDTSGAVRVHIAANDVSSSGGTSAADGAAYVASTTAGTPMMGARDDTSPGVLAEDKVGIVRLSTRREMYTQLRDAAGNERGANVNASNEMLVKDTTSNTSLSSIATKLTYGYTDQFPQYNNMTQPLAVSSTPLLTSNGALITDSFVGTDGGSVRANFTGSSINTSLGTCTFTNGSPYVTGTGFSTSSVEVLSMVKLNADTEGSYTPVQYIISDTQLQLSYPYVGTSTTGAASYAPLATSTGAGATISVASGQCTLASGTTNASQSFLWGVSSTGDLQAQASYSISQRISTQDIYFGLEDNALASITKFARFHFSGTDNTKVITETGYNPTTTPSANETETNTVTLPNGATTATSRVYKIALTQDNIVFSIDGIVVATHTKRIPHIRRTSNIGFVTLDLRVLNGTGATNTNIVVDYITGRLYNRLDTFQSSVGDATNSQVVSQKAATTSSNTLQSAAAATGNGISLVTDGLATVIFTVTGTFVGTITFEATEDGTNYTGINVLQAGSNTLGSTTTTTGTFVGSCTGFINVRARISAYTSGSITVTAHASPLNMTPRVVNSNALVGGSSASTGNGATDASTQRVAIAGAVATADATSNPTAPPVAGFGMVYNGASWERMRGDLGDASAATGVLVNNALIFNGTTYDRQRSAAATTNTSGTGLGGIVSQPYAITALPTAATATNFTNAVSDKFGRQVVVAGTIRDLVGTQTTTISASTSETTIVTAAASTFNDITALVCSNTSATAARIDFRDTTAGSVLFSVYVPAGDVRGVAFQRPVPQTTVNTNWTAQSSASVTDLRIYATFDKNK